MKAAPPPAEKVAERPATPPVKEAAPPPSPAPAPAPPAAREPVVEQQVPVIRKVAEGRSFGPNVYFGAVSDPKNKEVGLEAALVLSPSEGFSLLLGAAIGEHIGVRAAAYFKLTEAGALRLWAGPRLLVTPLSAGTSVGGGAQLRAELQVAHQLDLVGAVAFEVNKAPAGTVVSPLLTLGAQTRF